MNKPNFERRFLSERERCPGINQSESEKYEDGYCECAMDRMCERCDVDENQYREECESAVGCKEIPRRISDHENDGKNGMK